MRSFAVYVFSSLFFALGCSALSLVKQQDFIKRMEKDGEYLTYEDCLKEAYAAAENCRATNETQLTVSIYDICDAYQDKLKRLCSAHCAKASCVDCFDKMEEIIKNCELFSEKIYREINATAKECRNETKMAIVKHCSHKECAVCKDSYCRNGGKCTTGPTAVWCACPPGYTGAFCQRSKCAKKPCKNGGTCIGDNRCVCPPRYGGPSCSAIKRLGTKENPAPYAQAIIDAGDSQGSGMYWIQPSGETAPAQTYCDMNYDGGGWMLASYGYVHKLGINVHNKAIPNMNNPFGYNWFPDQRSSSNGVINLPHGAVNMANDARYMIMAAGNNPATGGISVRGWHQYAYVYRISLQNNQQKITFANHNRHNGGQPGRMHVTSFTVNGLYGDTGTYSRYALKEALGVTWGDSYPAGYGFYDKNAHSATINKGPFFPSVHSGSGRSPCSGCTPTNFEPDVPGGSPHYNYHGWYTANGRDQIGQTSIWFK